MLYQNILNEIYVRNIIKSIGLVGKYIDNNDYLEYSLRKLNDDLYNYYEEIPTAVYYDNPIAKYIEFLEASKPINIKDQLILGKINTFSYISYIEDMMFIFTENMSNE